MKASSLLSFILAITLAIVCGMMVFGGYGRKVGNSETQTFSNNVIDNIMTRASVRAYQNKKVEDTKIDTLLKVAMASPTAGDKRPWRFVVVTDKKQIEAIADVQPYAKFAKEAPLIIVTCGDMRLTFDGAGRELWVQDLSAASENILLAAHAIGLGAVWTGCYPDKDQCKKLQKVLELPDEVIPLNAIIIGYPKHVVKPKDKWDETRVSYDAYDE